MCIYLYKKIYTLNGDLIKKRGNNTNKYKNDLMTFR